MGSREIAAMGSLLSLRVSWFSGFIVTEEMLDFQCVEGDWISRNVGLGAFAFISRPLFLYLFWNSFFYLLFKQIFV